MIDRLADFRRTLEDELDVTLDDIGEGDDANISRISIFNGRDSDIDDDGDLNCTDLNALNASHNLDASNTLDQLLLSPGANIKGLPLATPGSNMDKFFATLHNDSAVNSEDNSLYTTDFSVKLSSVGQISGSRMGQFSVPSTIASPVDVYDINPCALTFESPSMQSSENEPVLHSSTPIISGSKSALQHKRRTMEPIPEEVQTSPNSSTTDNSLDDFSPDQV
jgi:hypothetical protein